VDGHSTSQGAADGDANGAHGDDLAHRREASGAAYPASTDRQALSAPCAHRCGRRGALCRCLLPACHLCSVGGVSPLAPPCHLSASHTHLPSPPAPALPPPALLPRPTTPREVVYDLGKWQAGNSLGFRVHGGRAASALPMGLYAHDSLRDEA
jgi:hypothetical protein